MRKIIGIFCILFVALIVTIGFLWKRQASMVVSPVDKTFEKPLDKYTIENLGKRQFVASPIIFDEAVATTSAYTVYTFHFTSDTKKVTGVAHVPNKKQEKFPVIVQFRGYVDREKYTPGEGTKRSSEVFAKNGFLTLAPDFLGYGGSDNPSTDVFEERFETYTTALNFIASIKTLPAADPGRVGVWGHSNGGQIALTVLEVLGAQGLPTTLWAPVSKPFPYSILYYTDEADDHGKLLRKRLSQFENEYDVELYSLTNYLDRISAPMQIHQGTADESVPEKWSDQLVEEFKMKNSKLKIDYFVYPSADHNLVPAWDTVVSRDIAFFKKLLNR